MTDPGSRIGRGEIEVVRDRIALDELRAMAETTFGELVKAVVDIERGIMAVGGELHADEEALLVDSGSSQVDLWGINLYPSDYGGPGWLEFDSMINVRPRHGNRSRAVEDPSIREQVAAIVSRLVTS